MSAGATYALYAIALGIVIGYVIAKREGCGCSSSGISQANVHVDWA